MTYDKSNPNGKQPIVYKTIPSDRLWVDPHLITTICQYIPYDVILTPNEPTLIAANDPRRAAVGFVSDQAVGVIQVAPYSDLNFSGFSFSEITTSISWYHLHKHYSMVTTEWYAFAAMAFTIRVITIIRQ